MADSGHQWPTAADVRRTLDEIGARAPAPEPDQQPLVLDRRLAFARYLVDTGRLTA